ncbi:MAG TPA: hypothetical protein VFU15_00070 [Bacteroidia bacterium]|nr:hypothetical protein [Bacteroidia bacterium]
MKKETLESRIKKADEYLVGLWKFRERGKRPVWCTTFLYQGYYYDTPGKNSPEAALDALIEKMEKLKKKHPPEKKATPGNYTRGRSSGKQQRP